jgi:hypothetical protein
MDLSWLVEQTVGEKKPPEGGLLMFSLFRNCGRIPEAPVNSCNDPLESNQAGDIAGIPTLDLLASPDMRAH